MVGNGERGKEMNMFQWMQRWLENDDTKVIYFLVLILCANTIDMLLGWLNAKFNKSVQFSSSKAIYGIARKMILFILCVFFIPVSMLVPYPVGIGAMYVLFTGYLLSEINSILSHLKLSEDDKSTDKFIDFINKLFSKGDN
jgi:toxin secretion/phage lysis holin